jgi:hypothetical protein
MLHVFKGEVLANMTQVSDVAPGPLVFLKRSQGKKICLGITVYKKIRTYNG